MEPTEEMWKADDPDGTIYGSLEAYAIEKYNDVSSISGIFKSFSDAPGGFKEEMEEIQWSVGAGAATYPSWNTGMEVNVLGSSGMVDLEVRVLGAADERMHFKSKVQ
jgi:hypothetical protein